MKKFNTFKILFYYLKDEKLKLIIYVLLVLLTYIPSILTAYFWGLTLEFLINKNLSNFIYKYWNDRKMILTFPNLKIQDKDGNIIYFRDLVPDVKPYYFMIYEKN